MTDVDSTFYGLGPQGSRGLWAGRITLCALACVVAAGLFGWLGVRTETVHSSASGYELSLQYPRTARAGLDVTWQATVTHPGGFGDMLTLTVTGDYFDIFETQGFFPDPDSQTRDGDVISMTFKAPPGDTFVLSYDAYIQPSSQVGRDGTLAVDVGGRSVASVDFSTWLAP